MNIEIDLLNNVPVPEQKIEIVERKGLGHPDSLADGIAEEVSKALSKHYLKNYERVLHHNTDQVEIVGGKVDVSFGRGKILKPIHILLSGRAIAQIGSKEIDVHNIAIKAGKDYLRKNLPNLDVENGVTFDSKIGHSNVDLADLYEREHISANDTSFGVGFAPLSETENLVLSVEKFLNSEKIKKKHPEIGEDIKVMGLRWHDKIKLTIAAAFLAKKIPDFNYYAACKEDILESLRNFVSENCSMETEIFLNTADNYDKELVYLTLTGTSAEAGDDGSVGRGNRANGLITPLRQMSLEASSGKNPLAHVGKIYNLMANKIAQDIYQLGGSKEVYVKILSQIGLPINQPQVVAVDLIPNSFDPKLRIKVEDIIKNHFDKLHIITQDVIEGKLLTF